MVSSHIVGTIEGLLPSHIIAIAIYGNRFATTNSPIAPLRNQTLRHPATYLRYATQSVQTTNNDKRNITATNIIQDIQRKDNEKMATLLQSRHPKTNPFIE
jgi:restriction endonuclease S subunit